jgi:methyltransferase-like protein
MDFIARRRFRETLFCRKGIPLDRKLSLERFRRLFASCNMKPGAIEADGTQVFHFPSSGTLSTNHPLARRLLCDLGSIWPRAIQLTEFSCDEYTPDSVAEMLMRLFRNKVIELRIQPPRLAEGISERPRVSDLARTQIALGHAMVTNQRHMDVELNDELSRTFIALIDGSRNRAALIRDLVKGGADPETTSATLESGLLEMYQMCLLIA